MYRSTFYKKQSMSPNSRPSPIKCHFKCCARIIITDRILSIERLFSHFSLSFGVLPLIERVNTSYWREIIDELTSWCTDIYLSTYFCINTIHTSKLFQIPNGTRRMLTCGLTGGMSTVFSRWMSDHSMVVIDISKFRVTGLADGNWSSYNHEKNLKINHVNKLVEDSHTTWFWFQCKEYLPPFSKPHKY